MTTGNEIVDKVARINITGNIVPMVWNKYITRKTGKPYLLAVHILADIVYWYRPSEKRDESTGNIVSIQKKFKADLLQRNYEQLSDSTGFSKREVKEAVERLEELGLIRKHWRTLEIAGRMQNNVLFIELLVDGLMRITHTTGKESINLLPKEDGNSGNTSETKTTDFIDSNLSVDIIQQPSLECQDSDGEIIKKEDENTNNVIRFTPSTVKATPANTSDPVTQISNSPSYVNTLDPPTQMGMTDTKITTESTANNVVNPVSSVLSTTNNSNDKTRLDPVAQIGNSPPCVNTSDPITQTDKIDKIRQHKVQTIKEQIKMLSSQQKQMKSQIIEQSLLLSELKELLMPSNAKKYNTNVGKYVDKLAVLTETEEKESDDKEKVLQKYDAIKQQIRNNIYYDSLKVSNSQDMGLVDEMVEIIIDTQMSNEPYIRVQKTDKPAAVVKSALLKLDNSHIEYVIDRLGKVQERIIKKKEYLLTMLYNSQLELNTYYHNAVIADGAIRKGSNITTKEQIVTNEARFKDSPKKTSKFANYAQNTIDYELLERVELKLLKNSLKVGEKTAFT
ncbi:MAG: DUF6017 domain-containing protein [Defluviitaleaceae bacterium]|nr:DUF6017 domain-containing protein [Defluviitaleaceae bacterium]